MKIAPLHSIRLAIARWIAPTGTVVVPPAPSIRMPRPTIVPTVRPAFPEGSTPDFIRVVVPRRGTCRVDNKTKWDTHTGVRYEYKLYIKQCSDPHFWYADKVGTQVPYEATWSDGYKSREDSGSINIVKLEDADIVRIEYES